MTFAIFIGESNIPAGFVADGRAEKFIRPDRPRRECCRPTFVSASGPVVPRAAPALCAEQCAAPAIMCRFVSDRFLRSYIFHAEPRAFPRAAPLKVSTIARRFASRPLYIPPWARPASELIVATREFPKISLSLSLFRGLVRKITATWRPDKLR